MENSLRTVIIFSLGRKKKPLPRMWGGCICANQQQQESKANKHSAVSSCQDT